MGRTKCVHRKGCSVGLIGVGSGREKKKKYLCRPFFSFLLATAREMTGEVTDIFGCGLICHVHEGKASSLNSLNLQYSSFFFFLIEQTHCVLVVSRHLGIGISGAVKTEPRYMTTCPEFLSRYLSNPSHPPLSLSIEPTGTNCPHLHHGKAALAESVAGGRPTTHSWRRARLAHDRWAEQSDSSTA